jgi:hypothetical protein
MPCWARAAAATRTLTRGARAPGARQTTTVLASGGGGEGTAAAAQWQQEGEGEGGTPSAPEGTPSKSQHSGRKRAATERTCQARHGDVKAPAARAKMRER